MREERSHAAAAHTASDLTAASPAFGPDALGAVDIDEVVRRRTSQGGTGHERVAEQLTAARDTLAADTAWLESLVEA